MTLIGFIGIGTMGKGMVLNLSKKYNVIAYNRTISKIEHMASDKITIANSLGEVTKADVIITCLPNDEIQAEVFEQLKDNIGDKVFIDCSTTSVELTKKMVDVATQEGFKFIDAPITGSKLGAEKGTMMFMVGGNKELVNKQMPIFDAMGERIVYCGENTYGQRAKIALNVTQAMVLESYLEGIILAMKNGVPLESIQEILDHSGAANTVASFKMPYIKNRDFTQHFMTKLMYKDLKLAEGEMEKLHLELPLAKQVVDVFKRAVDKGFGDEDMCSIVKLLEKNGEVEVK